MACQQMPEQPHEPWAIRGWQHPPPERDVAAASWRGDPFGSTCRTCLVDNPGCLERLHDCHAVQPYGEAQNRRDCRVCRYRGSIVGWWSEPWGGSAATGG